MVSFDFGCCMLLEHKKNISCNCIKACLIHAWVKWNIVRLGGWFFFLWCVYRVLFVAHRPLSFDRSAVQRKTAGTHKRSRGFESMVCPKITSYAKPCMFSPKVYCQHRPVCVLVFCAFQCTYQKFCQNYVSQSAANLNKQISVFTWNEQTWHLLMCFIWTSIKLMHAKYLHRWLPSLLLSLQYTPLLSPVV